jgi:hypothetical protein
LIIRSIDSTEIESFAQLIVSKVSFKGSLLSWINDGITKLEWCFVIEDNEKFLGRIVYGVLDNGLKILNIDIKDHSEIVIYKLLQSSLNEMKLKGLTGVECHLYSDKKYFEKYVEIFMKNGFNITQEKKSFIWEKANTININRVSERLVFKKLQEVDSNDYIDAIEKVTEGTLDEDDLECITEFGSKQAAINYFNLLKDIDFNKSWWKLAYTHNNELIGLVIPQKFNEDVGAINYIGVVPKKRGNGYVNDLIVEGIRILNENNIKKIIADIDVKNYPLEKALNKEEFKLDCRMLVLKLKF